MAAAASGATHTAADVVKKRTRLNPARRKSAKTKLAASPEPQSAGAGAGEKDDDLKAKSIVPAVKGTPSTKASNQPPRKPLQKSFPTLPIEAAKKSAKSSSNTDSQQSGNRKSRHGQAGALALATPAMVTGGLVGCAAGAAVIIGAGLWKNIAGVDSAILTARTAKLCMDNLVEEAITSLKAGTYSGPEAIDMLRRTTLAYATTIPGGAPFVEHIFQEVEMVRKQRGMEVDTVLSDVCTELGKAGERGATTAEMHTVVFKQLARLSHFATNATQDVMARNPHFRPFMTGAAKTLHPPPASKVPTVKVNMAVKHKLPRANTA